MVGQWESVGRRSLGLTLSLFGQSEEYPEWTKKDEVGEEAGGIWSLRRRGGVGGKRASERRKLMASSPTSLSYPCSLPDRPWEYHRDHSASGAPHQLIFAQGLLVRP